MSTEKKVGQRWGQFWKKHRNGASVLEIAQNNKISTQAVYKALSSKNSKIEGLLLMSAKTNRIRVNHYDSNEGFLWGFSPGFQSDVYITYSPKTGTQVWYKHEADCSQCEALAECLWLLKTEAKEREIVILPHLKSPSEIALFLFEAIKNKLGWTKDDF